MLSVGTNFINTRNVCCGLILVILHAWASLVVWILIDIGLVTLLILPRVLQLIRKTSTRVDVMIPGSAKNGQGGFSTAMADTLSNHKHGNNENTRIRSSSRRTKYNHDFSRYTPNDRNTITPLPTISAIRNRLSYR